MLFDEFNLHEKVLRGIKKAGFEKCMPVQEKSLPLSLSGQDIMVQSKTGSGKTAVFIITFLEKYLRKKEKGENASCLIIAPTRELAQQISQDAKKLCCAIKGFRIGCFIGGSNYEKQRKQLENNCEIYVGTPGRILDFMKSRYLKAKQFDTFVIDEADRLFDMGFYPDLVKIISYLVPKENRQTMLFSATLEMKVRNLAYKYMNNPVEIELESSTMTVDSITQELFHVAKSEKFHLLLQLLISEKPDAVLIFTNRCSMTENLSKRLKFNGFNADYISGNLTQKKREQALAKLKKGEINILVATDVAARGLQIDNLPLVINYDLPEDYENYVHRVGRTARAGKSGKAISLADEEFVYSLEAIEKYIKMKIPVCWPDNLPEVEERKNTYSETKDREIKRFENQSSTETSSTEQNSTEQYFTKQKFGKKEFEKYYSGNKQITQQKKDSVIHKSSMSEEQRLAFYKKKYGFVPLKTEKTHPVNNEVSNSVSSSDSEKKEKKKISFFRYVWSLPFIIAISVFMVIFACLPSLLLRLFGLKKAGNFWIFFWEKIASDLILFLYNVKVQVSGNSEELKMMLKGKEKLCFIANHTSLLDIPLLESKLNLNSAFIAKSVLRFFPFINIVLASSHCVLIYRNNLRKSADSIRKGVRKIQKGYRMTIFPEGTRSKTGQILMFKKGAFKLASLSGATVVPITIKGIRNALEDRKKIFGRTQCYLNIGKPVSFAGLDRESTVRLSEQIENNIKKVYSKL